MMITCPHNHSSKHKKAYLIGPDCSGHSHASVPLLQLGGDQPFADHPANIQDTNHTTPPHQNFESLISSVKWGKGRDGSIPEKSN